MGERKLTNLIWSLVALDINELVTVTW
ncbi:hypothetical protein F383_32493 [Gossypium arboreum]|uniref:Uncharacterized protein n=1 Tax=Gossypium arboreum TaxID=29729 RepID=A0A0B0PKA1_GOSAR|nr:hypothetical protein F383_32493 [Gossypium arboreum]